MFPHTVAAGSAAFTLKPRREASCWSSNDVTPGSTDSAPVVEVEVDASHAAHVEDDAVGEDEPEHAAAVAAYREWHVEPIGQRDDGCDFIRGTGQDHVTRHPDACQRERVVGVREENGGMVRGPVGPHDRPQALEDVVRGRREHRLVLVEVRPHAVFQRLHDRHGAHARHEVALHVADAAQGAGVGGVDERSCHRDEAVGQRPVEIHAPLRIIGDVLLLRARRAQPGPQVVDLAHGVVPALGGRLSHAVVVRGAFHLHSRSFAGPPGLAPRYTTAMPLNSLLNRTSEKPAFRIVTATSSAPGKTRTDSAR